MNVIGYEGAQIRTPAHEGDARNTLRYLSAAYDDEPLFVIRGRDLFSVPVINAYANLAFKCGLPAMGEQVSRHLSRFEAWRALYPSLVKIPDPFPGWNK